MSGVKRVWLLNLCLVLIGATLYLLVVRNIQPIQSPISIPWWGMAALFYLDEICVVHLKFKQDAYSFSLAEIPLIIGLFFATPEALVLGQLVGSATALGFHRRQSLLKLVFNTAHYVLEACVACIIFFGLVPATGVLGAEGWLAAASAGFAASYLSVLMVALAISLSEGAPRWDTLPTSFTYATIGTATTTCLALLGATVIWVRVEAALLLVVPSALLFLAYRAYMHQLDKRESVEFLYESTRLTQSHLETDAAMSALLGQAREMFRAEVAQITLFGEEDVVKAVRTGLGPGDQRFNMTPVRLDPQEGVWARVASEAKALLLARPFDNHRIAQHFAERGIFKDAMVAPLFSGEKVIGTLMVGDRLGDVSTFDEEDLKLFETLTNHTSVSLDNARLVDRLRESLAHLTEMNSLKDDFVAAVSHELRTPLTSIQGYVKTMLRPNVSFTDEQRQTFLEAVDRQSDRLRSLIEDLLVVSRLEAQPVSTSMEQVELGQVFERVLAELAHRTTTHEVQVTIAPDIPPLHSDVGKIHQVVSNLIDNACKYSDDDAGVEVSACADGEGVLISVRDEGEGIPEEVREKVFDRFYQVDQTSTRAAGGTGLGLYICRRLAETLGGRVWIERSTSEGSTFSLWIPQTVPVHSMDPGLTQPSPAG
jgi:signal transduction histidine kinase